jgi:beta-aspartyl-dipeptidase (metallo-type)
VLPLFTMNTARVLKLNNKGSLQEGKDADVLVLDSDSLELVHVFARGRQLVSDGRMAEKSEQEKLVEEAQA